MTAVGQGLDACVTMVSKLLKRLLECERRLILKLLESQELGEVCSICGLDHSICEFRAGCHSCSGLCRELKTTSVGFQMSLALLGIAGAFQFDLIWIVPGT